MNYRKLITVPIAMIMLFVAMPGFAADVNELERRLNIVSDELDRLKNSSGGSGIASRTTVHGYGEMHLQMPDNGPSLIDQHRFVIGIHSELADWIHLNAEIDFEHAAQELEFEYGQLDFLLTNNLNARAGVMLMPMGNLNEFHEPPLFWTAERPEFHSKIIPSTWQQGGAGIFGQLGEGINYRLYAVNALQGISTGTDGDSGYFRDEDGLRKGRLQMDYTKVHDFALTGRLEKKVNGGQLGFSFYTGDSTNGHINEGGNVTMLEADMKWRKGAFELNNSIANVSISDADEMNTFCASAAGGRGAGSCRDDIPDNIFGLNLQAGLHLPQAMGWSTTHDIIPHIMYEKIRPADDFGANAATADRSKNFDRFLIGVSYMPVPKVAIKMDWSTYDYQTAATDDKSTVEMAIAYMY